MSKLIESVRTKAKLLQKAKLKSDPDFQLKEAYEILAKTAGFSSWREWKEILQDHSVYAPPGGAHWHVWYAQYEEALKHLAEVEGVYLIPYQKHFFICDNHYIRTLGIENDPDLNLIGQNWVEPKNAQAWQRVCQKLKKRPRPL